MASSSPTSTPTPTPTPAPRARILIVDDHPVLRGGLAQLLSRQPDVECCGEAGTAREALALARREKPNLAIVDLRLKQGDGLDLIKDFRAEMPSVLILVLSQHTEPVYVERSLRAGALGYVAKEQDPAEVLAAVRSILGGQVYLSRGMASDLLQGFVGPSSRTEATGVSQLTDRELAVLNLLGEGKSTREIAAQLSVSFKTVESHRENIKHKLHLRDATELVHFATQWASQPADVSAETFTQHLTPPGAPPGGQP